MPARFEVSIDSVLEIPTLPGIWSEADLRRLLTLAEYEDASQVEEPELLDMGLMVLQDLGNQKAGELVLEAVFGDTMRPGVRQNLVDDLQQDEPWADFAVVAQQRGIFVAVVLLQQAFPNRYGAPKALQLRFTARSASEAGIAEITAARPAWLVRLLSCGMAQSDVLPRLYEQELISGPFTDAGGMVWQCSRVSNPGDPAIGKKNAAVFELISSRLWFAPLTRGMQFQACL